MLVERSLDPRHLSNAYIVGDGPGGVAVLVDTGAPLAPLLGFANLHALTPTHILRTHGHFDHVEHEGSLGLPVVTGSLRTGGLEIEAIPTPGHCDDMVCFVIGAAEDEQLVFSGDTLFRDSIGGGDLEAIRHVVMDIYMTMPHERRLFPGHADASTIGREWEHNPFIAVWRGSSPEGSERVSVGERPARLVAWSPDYDGKGKAWVRYDDGVDAIVGGSSLRR